MLTETVGTDDSLGRTVSNDVLSPLAVPSFRKSAVDGYACKAADLKVPLTCIGTVHAGSGFDEELAFGQCVKIMTGARVPRGADHVFMYENAQVLADGKITCVTADAKTNICETGEDVQVGQVVVQRDTLVKPHHISVLASVGVAQVQVYKTLKVGIIATGTELIEPYGQALPFQTRNSNSPLFRHLVPNSVYYGITVDDKQVIAGLMQRAFEECDVLLVTGGASDSEFDLVPLVATELGFAIEVKKVSIQPGKPFMFAHRQATKFCFGLSGNPVSSYIQFLLFVRHFLRLPGSQVLKLPLAENFKRKNAQRDLFVPVQTTPKGVVAVPYNGSAHIAAFAAANGIMHVPQGIHELKQGDWVDVRPI